MRLRQSHRTERGITVGFRASDEISHHLAVVTNGGEPAREALVVGDEVMAEGEDVHGEGKRPEGHSPECGECPPGV